MVLGRRHYCATVPDRADSNTHESTGRIGGRDMRILKALAIVAVCIAVVVWFAAMASLGMAKQDEWYQDKGKDTGIAIQDIYVREI